MNMDDLSRTLMTMHCQDCNTVPKVADAGRIVVENGELVQIMHNGLRVVAGGYHGDWMAHIIRGLHGHHEPQEELVFHSLLRLARHNTLMAELGAFWAYYSLWFLREVPGSQAVCIEPDPNHRIIGERNAALNGLTDRVKFVDGWVGGSPAMEATYSCESTGLPRTLPTFDMPALMNLTDGRSLEILHIDAQGAELPFIASMPTAALQAKVRFLVVSTHHRVISGSATTHADCLKAIRSMGGHVLIEHNVQQSFSGDGLIAASFYAQDRNVVLPAISRNVATKSLFPKP
jgi:FkbM family methyltransferase